MGERRNGGKKDEGIKEIKDRIESWRISGKEE